MLTFLLVFVIFATAVDGRGHGTIAPIIIGFTVVVDHLLGKLLASSLHECADVVDRRSTHWRVLEPCAVLRSSAPRIQYVILILRVAALC